MHAFDILGDPVRRRILEDQWLNPYRRFWTQRLDALATELARGKRDRRAADPTTKGTGKL
jgi:hypothetical protein